MAGIESAQNRRRCNRQQHSAVSRYDEGAINGISTPKQRHDRRYQLRATAGEETLIKVAAGKASIQTRFVLDEGQWKRFMQALDRPPRVKPRLRKFFSESHVGVRRSEVQT